MKNRFITSIATVVFALSSAIAAHAVPVQWTLSNAVFDDGGTASGSFVFDAATNDYSNIAISTVAGTSGSAFTYANIPPVFFKNPGQFFGVSATGDLTGAGQLFLNFSGPMTDAGGTLDIVLSSSSQAVCSNADCTFISTPFQRFVSGSIVSSPVSAVPLPAGLALGLTGMAAFGAARRRGRRS